MTLLITAFTAIIVLVIRVTVPSSGRKGLGTLALAYLGASLMWMVDGFASLLSGEAFIELHNTVQMQDDALLGFIIVASGLALWTLSLVVHRIKSAVSKRALS